MSDTHEGLLDIGGAARVLRSRTGSRPDVVIVLGSGLGQVVDAVQDPVTVPFTEIPGYPGTSVAGHSGRYVAGRLGDAEVLLQCGRFHCYEGHSWDVVGAPVRVAAAAGSRVLVLTNASGGIREDLRPGTIMMVEDHLNLMGGNPLEGAVRSGEERFPDMSEAYDAGLRTLAREVAEHEGIELRAGVYAAVRGPSYETPAEVRMLERLGADVVGMSTVPEVAVARALGLRTLAFSVVTNLAAGKGGEPLTHEDVVRNGTEAAKRLSRLLAGLLPRLSGYDTSAK